MCYSPATRNWEVPYSGVIATKDDLPSTPGSIGAQPKITAKGLLKGNGNGSVVAATRGSDYIASGNIVKQTLVSTETTPTEDYAINWIYG